MNILLIDTVTDDVVVVGGWGWVLLNDDRYNYNNGDVNYLIIIVLERLCNAIFLDWGRSYYIYILMVMVIVIANGVGGFDFGMDG